MENINRSDRYSAFSSTCFGIALVIFSLLLVFPSFCLEDFQHLMGKDTAAWDYVQTAEDVRLLNFYQKQFEEALASLKEKRGAIPNQLHVIWLGPKNFPEQSIKNLKSWKRLHPHWKIYFWIDLDREIPLEGMEKRFVQDYSFTLLGECFDRAENEGEKSVLLRYEILWQEGGVYADHDVMCKKSFTAFNENWDFYCGLEPLGPSILSSSVFVGPHLIASRPHHPIFRRTMEKIRDHWDSCEQNYSGTTPQNLCSRITHRSIEAFSDAVKEGLADDCENKNIVFPALFFNHIDDQAPLFSAHMHQRTWLKKESESESQILYQLGEITKGQYLLKGLLVVALSLILMSGVLLIYSSKSKRHPTSLLLIIFFSLPGWLVASDFELYMGKQTRHWSYANRTEEMAYLESLKSLYEKNLPLLHEKGEGAKIPYVIHFIWLGPKPFPAKSVENVRTWMAKNPGWKVKFWTDRFRPLPCHDMELHQVDNFRFSRLKRCYDESKNYGEKSDILRYEILFQEGGVYVDHDANCLRPFAPLHHAYDFYCGLEIPHVPFAGHQITSGNGVLGSRAGHPVVQGVLSWIERNWDSLGRQFRGSDAFFKAELVLQRTYIALTHSLKENLGRENNKDIVFPAAYFFAKGGIPSLYSKHFFANSWADDQLEKNYFNKKILQSLSKIKQKNQMMTIIVLVILILNAMIIFRCFWKKKQRQTNIHP